MMRFVEVERVLVIPYKSPARTCHMPAIQLVIIHGINVKAGVPFIDAELNLVTYR